MVVSETATARQETLDVVLEADGRIALPDWALDQVGLKAGDRLVLSVLDDGIALVSRRLGALRALDELRRGFAEAGITEEELQEEGRRVREELVKERYGIG
jgi:bifunctional DNA-binding transcriptional regulator/antitoxin component of YhaV-PrlF toxin-antitoxin module